MAALGHESRLSVYRLLIKAGEKGLNVGDIGQHLEMPASTLAHHLSALVSTGLVTQERRGRDIRNFADYTAMDGLVEFLTRNCCQGVDTLEKA